MRVATHLYLRPAILTASIMVAVTTATGAQFSVPSPSNSILPGCLLTTPGGNIPSVFVVRDLANNPVNASLLVLDYSSCVGFVPCSQSGGPSDPYIVNTVARTIRMFTDVSGQAVLPLRAGGGCSSNGIAVYADGVFLGSLRAASADQNGDLAVDASDIAAATAKVGSANLTGDLDCNGIVNAGDVAIVSGYVGVNCLRPTKAMRPTWGRIKTIYR